jgi:hypothetical protein
MMQRDLPGQGGIDLLGLLTRVGARAADPALELEIFHPDLRSAGAREAAGRMAGATRVLLASAARARAAR